MQRLSLAYRDDDRTPVIYCIREMARRHYDVDVEIVQIRGTSEYEAALFDGSADVIIEHVEYLYADPTVARQVTMFCAPVLSTGLALIVRPEVSDAAQLRGGTIAIRSHGRPYGVHLRLRALGLEGAVATRIVADAEVGRWGQWRKVASGECVATFTSDLYVPDALAAGLKSLPAPDIEVVGHYAQACPSAFARAHDQLMRRYVQSVIHALCLLCYRRDDAIAIARGEPMRRMGIGDERELERQVDSIARALRPKPYPTPQALANTYALATAEFGGAGLLNPLTLWDLHWVKQLDDEGFIDRLIADLQV